MKTTNLRSKKETLGMARILLSILLVIGLLFSAAFIEGYGEKAFLAVSIPLLFIASAIGVIYLKEQNLGDKLLEKSFQKYSPPLGTRYVLGSIIKTPFAIIAFGARQIALYGRIAALLIILVLFSMAIINPKIMWLPSSGVLFMFSIFLFFSPFRKGKVR